LSGIGPFADDLEPVRQQPQFDAVVNPRREAVPVPWNWDTTARLLPHGERRWWRRPKCQVRCSLSRARYRRTGVRDLLAHWRHFAYQELREPGAYFRLLAKAARIQATGNPAPGSVSGEQVRALIAARLAEAGLTDAEQGR
jgi:Family of unknown function (DUF6247)